MKHRRAISLLELLLIMSAAIVVLSLTGVLLHRAMLVQLQSRERANVENTTLRFSEQFRRDVHDSREVTTDKTHNKAGVFFRATTGSSRTIEYTRQDGTILRVESGGDRPVRRESFEFPSTAELHIEQATAPARIVLTIQRRAAESPVASSASPHDTTIVPVSLHLEPLIGRNSQLPMPSILGAPQ